MASDHLLVRSPAFWPGQHIRLPPVSIWCPIWVALHARLWHVAASVLWGGACTHAEHPDPPLGNEAPPLSLSLTLLMLGLGGKVEGAEGQPA